MDDMAMVGLNEADPEGSVRPDDRRDALALQHVSMKPTPKGRCDSRSRTL